MMAASWVFWTAALVLTFYGFDTTDSQCVCPLTHPQTIYCNADFAILKAYPIVKTLVNSTYQYTLRSNDIEKGNKATKSILKKKKIFTDIDPANCGVDLTLGSHYILTGKIVNGTATIDECGIHTLWVKTKSNVIHGIMEKYKSGCSCTIDTCETGNCTKTDTSCIYDPQYTNGLQCYPKYGLCKAKKGICRWSNEDHSRLLTKCLSTTSTVALI